MVQFLTLFYFLLQLEVEVLVAFKITTIVVIHNTELLMEATAMEALVAW